MGLPPPAVRRIDDRRRRRSHTEVKNAGERTKLQYKSPAPQGGGTIDPPAGTHTDNENDVVTVTASPDAGWDFDHWEGDLSGSTNPTTITMDADKSVTAVFVQPTVWPNSMAVMGDSISRAALADDTVDVVKAEQTDPEHPAVLRIGLARETTVAAPEATVVLVKTDQPGGEAIRIPVLLRPPRQAGSE